MKQFADKSDNVKNTLEICYFQMVEKFEEAFRAKNLQGCFNNYIFNEELRNTHLNSITESYNPFINDNFICKAKKILCKFGVYDSAEEVFAIIFHDDKYEIQCAYRTEWFFDYGQRPSEKEISEFVDAYLNTMLKKIYGLTSEK